MWMLCVPLGFGSHTGGLQLGVEEKGGLRSKTTVIVITRYGYYFTNSN